MGSEACLGTVGLSGLSLSDRGYNPQMRCVAFRVRSLSSCNVRACLDGGFERRLCSEVKVATKF